MSCHQAYRDTVKHRTAILFASAVVLGILFVADLAVGASDLTIARAVEALFAGPSADSIDAVVYMQVPEESEEGLLMGSPVTLYLTTDTTKVPERPEPSDSTLVDMIPLENAD